MPMLRPSADITVREHQRRTVTAQSTMWSNWCNAARRALADPGSISRDGERRHIMRLYATKSGSGLVNTTGCVLGFRIELEPVPDSDAAGWTPSPNSWPERR